MKFIRNKVFRSVLLLVFLLTLVPAAWAAEGGQVPLEEIKEYVKNNYVGTVSEAVLKAKTAEELFEQLGDAHSGYLNPKQFEEFKISSAQEYAGVGMQLELQEECVVVTKVFPNTPAAEVGVRTGDRIKSINGEDMGGRSLGEVAGLVRGQAGSSVLIQFLRENDSEPFIVTMTRKNIHLEVIQHRMLGGGIGYISLDSFTPTAGSEFQGVLKDLQSQGLKALIFDVRQNPGGYLSTALDIGSMFVGVGEPLLHVAGREGDSSTYQSLTKALGIPMVMLVDGDSASAAEIVAGIVQDSGAGRIIGITTYGKASVQTVYPLSDGGAVKLTTARYLTPKKQDLNGVGLTPDQVVAEPEAQLEEAIAYLAGRLEQKKRVLILLPGQALWNGEEVALIPSPYEKEGRLLVPLRGVGELFGFNVDWDGTKNQARVSMLDKELQIVPGEKQALINGKLQELAVGSTMQEGRLFVPVRVLTDFLGAGCEYDSTTGAVTIIL